MVSIRAARTDDDEDLVRIDALTWSSLVTPAPVPPENHAFFSRVSAQDVIVAETDSKAVGYVQLQQAMSIASHEHVLDISGLAVDPAHQGRGVGRLLLKAAEQEARRRGARKLSLRVLGPNDVARRLYESCGFRAEGVLVGEFLLEGRLVDDVLMALRLD